MIRAHNLNAIIGCLASLNFDEALPTDVKDALFYVNEELQKIGDRQQTLYKPIAQLYHNQKKENEENGEN